MPFQLTSVYQPSGDQPQAIEKLVSNLKQGFDKQTLLGVTGSGKTFTIANVIQQTQLPTLIISHNKTLAGQLYQEFKELFPKNKVSYFVSYYDYYQPEAYVPRTDTYIAKEVDINDLLDKLRLETTSNLFSGPDNIVVASVSCIYNIGDPEEFSGKTIRFVQNQKISRRQLFEQLVGLFYSRNEMEFKRGTFRVRGEIVEIWTAYADWILELTLEDEEIKSIQMRNPFAGTEIATQEFLLFPAKQYVGGRTDQEIFEKIKKDTEIQVEKFKSQKKVLEAYRLKQRVDYDLEMLAELGYINGIENYSIYFEKNRHPGDPPYTLVDYFRHLWGENFLTVIDESHVTIPQIRGMFNGDLARKQNLINYGFRLPSALDNRPLKFDEFYQKVTKAIYVSATPAPYELEDSHNQIVEQIIRPTGLIDPEITIKSAKNQIQQVISEVLIRAAKHERSLIITITKRMAEDITTYLSDPSHTQGKNIKVAYLHSDVDTLERTEILDKLRRGDYDVLVGINLLREGIDLPEVTLVAILDAGAQGFLRSRSSLIQIMGRAARNVNGQVILYADQISDAIRQAKAEVDRRRKIQLKYNQEHNITAQSVQKAYREKIIEVPQSVKDLQKKMAKSIDPSQLTPVELKKYIKTLKSQMHDLAKDMKFEEAIALRDQIKSISTS